MNATIEIASSPAQDDELVVVEGLNAYNREHTPAEAYTHYTAFLRGADGAVLGGAICKAGRGWLHVSILWVDSTMRGGGFGTMLMRAAEDEARRRGCHSAYLDTFSYQARPFYERCGYRVFGTLDDYPIGHQRFFMWKSLVTSST